MCKMEVQLKMLSISNMLLTFAYMGTISGTAQECTSFFDQHSVDRPRIFAKNNLNVKTIYQPEVFKGIENYAQKKDEAEMISIMQYCGKVEIIAGGKITVKNHLAATIPFAVGEANSMMKADAKIIVKAPMIIHLHGVHMNTQMNTSSTVNHESTASKSRDGHGSMLKSRDVRDFVNDMEETNSETTITINKPFELHAYGDFTLVLLTSMEYKEHTEIVQIARIDASFIVKVSGHFIAVNNEKMDESTAVDNCGILQDIQRSICAQLDHNFYRFDTRVKNPIYLQCMIRNLSSNKNTVQLEVWLARQFVHLRCAQDTDSCAVHFVRKMILSPPENPPVLPYTLELDAHRMEVSVLYNGRMNTAGCQLRTRFQHVLSFALLSLLLISDN